MRHLVFACMVSGTIPAFADAADPKATTATAKPAQSKVDPAAETAETREDIRRHRAIAAAHEAAAKCREAGTAEAVCMADLAKACKGIVRQVLRDAAPGLAGRSRDGRARAPSPGQFGTPGP